MILTSLLEAVRFCQKIGADTTTQLLLMQQAVRRGFAVRQGLWYAKIVAEQTAVAYELRLPNPVLLHLRTQDMPMLFEIFKREDYRLPIEKTLDEGAVVVDLGAHIGLASIFFQQNYFPNARFIAIEPSPKNLVLLQKNLTAAMPKAEIAPVAVSNTMGLVQINDSEVGYNVYVIQNGVHVIRNAVPNTPVEVLSLTMSKIMEDLHISRIDLLKMDIEGAEKSVLGDAAAWLPKVQMLVVELHGDYSETNLRSAVEPLGFHVSKGNAKHLYFARRIECVHA
jgi:FkbM family methyltransferase